MSSLRACATSADGTPLRLAEVVRSFSRRNGSRRGRLGDRRLRVAAQRDLHSVQLGPLALGGDVADYVLDQVPVTGVARRLDVGHPRRLDRGDRHHPDRVADRRGRGRTRCRAWRGGSWPGSRASRNGTSRRGGLPSSSSGRTWSAIARGERAVVAGRRGEHAPRTARRRLPAAAAPPVSARATSSHAASPGTRTWLRTASSTTRSIVDIRARRFMYIAAMISGWRSRRCSFCAI